MEKKKIYYENGFNSTPLTPVTLILVFECYGYFGAPNIQGECANDIHPCTSFIMLLTEKAHSSPCYLNPGQCRKLSNSISSNLLKRRLKQYYPIYLNESAPIQQLLLDHLATSLLLESVSSRST
jgi:hypothetical protein